MRSNRQVYTNAVALKTKKQLDNHSVYASLLNINLNNILSRRERAVP